MEEGYYNVLALEAEKLYGVVSHSYVLNKALSEEEQPFYYNIDAIVVEINPESRVEEEETLLIMRVSQLVYFWLKDKIFKDLYDRTCTYPKLDLFLSLLSAIYLGCLLFY
jgi:hypothetical protein